MERLGVKWLLRLYAVLYALLGLVLYPWSWLVALFMISENHALSGIPIGILKAVGILLALSLFITGLLLWLRHRVAILFGRIVSFTTAFVFLLIILASGRNLIVGGLFIFGIPIIVTLLGAAMLYRDDVIAFIKEAS